MIWEVGTMSRTKEESARILAQKHFELDDGLRTILWFKGTNEAEANAREPIKLLEVNAATVSSGVMPLHFAAVPSMGIPYPSVIVEVTPDEYKRIEKKELSLPKNWLTHQELPKAAPSMAENMRP